MKPHITQNCLPYYSNLNKTLSLPTFVAVGEPPLLARLDVGYPQVVIVDKGYEVRVSRANLGVHAGP